MYRFNRLRWRIARWIAPAPIIAAPLDPGPAILMRDADHPEFVAWITPTTLEIQMHSSIGPLRLGGTITGTI